MYGGQCVMWVCMLSVGQPVREEIQGELPCFCCCCWGPVCLFCIEFSPVGGSKCFLSAQNQTPGAPPRPINDSTFHFFIWMNTGSVVLCSESLQIGKYNYLQWDVKYKPQQSVQWKRLNKVDNNFVFFKKTDLLLLCFLRDGMALGRRSQLRWKEVTGNDCFISLKTWTSPWNPIYIFFLGLFPVGTPSHLCLLLLSCLFEYAAVL